jgi:hypothetical protein
MDTVEYSLPPTGSGMRRVARRAGRSFMRSASCCGRRRAASAQTLVEMPQLPWRMTGEGRKRKRLAGSDGPRGRTASSLRARSRQPSPSGGRPCPE